MLVASSKIARWAFVLCIIAISCARAYANLTADNDVEQGKAMEARAFDGIGRENYGKMAELYRQSKKSNEWWTNRSCKTSYLLLSGCGEKVPQKCFGVDIFYVNRVETDEQFPHWVEFLRHFPKCWRWIGPLVCLVHYRPCDFVNNPGGTSQHTIIELFRAQLCDEMRSHCEFALRHFPKSAASYLSCEARVHRLDSASRPPPAGNGVGSSLQQRNGTSAAAAAAVPVYQPNCNIRFLNSSSHSEVALLKAQANACIAPLVYVNSTEETERTHALPLVDDCFMPCSSTLYTANSISVLSTFTFMCFFLVLVFAVLLLSRVKHIFDFGIFICFLAIVSTSLIALTFAVSPFVGNDIVCLLGGKIRRFSGVFALANGNDILCMLEAAYLKVCLVFAFWTSFIFVCNDFSARHLFLQQFSAFCHISISLLITLWHREISIDPVSKTCHYFRVHSLLPSIADFGSLLLVALFIFYLSKAKLNSKKKGSKAFPMDQVLISTSVLHSHQNELFSVRTESKTGAEHRAEEEEEGVAVQQCQAPFLQRIVDELARMSSPLLLLSAYFGCVLSFYPLADLDENDLLSAQINCSLSAISTETWRSSGHLDSCRPAPRTPSWHYVNSFALVADLLLTLSVISSSLSKLLKSDNGGSSMTNDDEETEEDDNKNGIEMGFLAGGQAMAMQSTPETHQMDGNRTTVSNSNCSMDVHGRAPVADSICSNGYAAIDSSASVHSVMNSAERRSRRRRLDTLRGGGRVPRNNGERMERRGKVTTTTTTIGQNGAEMMSNGGVASRPSSYSESHISSLYQRICTPQSATSADFTGPPFPNGPLNQPPMAPPLPNGLINQPSMAPLFSNGPLNQPPMAPPLPNGLINQPSMAPLFSNGPLNQPPMAPPTAAPAPLIVVHHWHQYYPAADGVQLSQSCVHQPQPDDGNGMNEFTAEVGGGEVNGTENGGDQNEREEEEITDESEYPISDHDTADSNDFCSDNPDSAEEQLWNERCRRAAESRQSAQIG